MKKSLSSFVSGVICTLLVCGLSISALAATGLVSIDVETDVNLLVNGVRFQPKNEGGEDVPLFNYQGTIYAPVRALAKAYGLEVGWDSEQGIATVNEPEVKTPDPAAKPDYSDWTAEQEEEYQAFLNMWEVTKSELDLTKTQRFVDVRYVGESEADDVSQKLKDNPRMMERYMNELNTDSSPAIYLHFYLQDRCVGSIAFIFGVLSISNG